MKRTLTATVTELMFDLMSWTGFNGSQQLVQNWLTNENTKHRLFLYKKVWLSGATKKGH